MLLLTTVTLDAQIQVNQLGYFPNQPKEAMVVETSSTSFEVIDAESGSTVHNGSLSGSTWYEDAKQNVRTADFSALTTPGRYFLRVSGEDDSPVFEIRDDLYYEALRASVKAFYTNRSSTELLAEHAGIWARPASHPDTSVELHWSTIVPNDEIGDTKASPKGWYDAGDFGKYTVPGAVALKDLLAAYERYPGTIGDQLNIPESNNNRNDILDEAKWKLDWLLTMQDDDDYVYHKLTTKGFGPSRMPHEDTEQRYFIGRSTQATLDFAAVMAQAGRIWRDDLNNGSQGNTYINAAEAAWDWAVNNPNKFYDQPSDISTGPYEDNNSNDEFFWAAAELYVTTGDSKYHDYLVNNKDSVPMHEQGGWSRTENYAYFLIALHPDASGSSLRNTMRSDIKTEADAILTTMAGNPYGIPLSGTDFRWSSNSHIGRKAMILLHAYDITVAEGSADSRYLEGAIANMDYIFGKNATNYSFMTGFGSQTPTHPHHRQSDADFYEEPVPGFVVGGPNANAAGSGDDDGVDYPGVTSNEPALAYYDDYAAFASNEVAVYYNSPNTFTLAGLDYHLGSSVPPQAKDDTYGVPAGESLVADAMIGVLANDQPGRSASSPLTASLVEDVAVGTLTLNADGTFSYTPPADFKGNVYFTYTVNDGNQTSAPATVSVSVGALDQAFAADTVTGLEIWLDAQHIDLDAPDPNGWYRHDGSDTYIKTWENRAGTTNTTQYTSSKQPLYVADGLNGLPAVRFDDDEDWQMSAGSPRNSLGDLTYFVVSGSNSTGSTNWQRIIAGETFELLRPHNSGNPQAYQPQIFYQELEDEKIADVEIGHNSPDDTGSHLKGNISEVMIFSQNLTEQDRLLVEGYLSHKWGLTDQLDTLHPYKNQFGEPLDDYDAWLQSWPDLPAPAPADDPDGDGLPNLIEYATGQDPATGMHTASPIRFETIQQGGQNYYRVVFRRWADSDLRGLTYDVEITDSLKDGTWLQPGEAGYPAMTTTVQGTDANGMQEVWMTFVQAVADTVFARLKVTR